MPCLVISSTWSFASKLKLALSPHTLTSSLSASLSPSGTVMSGMFGTCSISDCHSSITGFSSSSSFWISALSACICVINCSRTALSKALGIPSETLFCSALRASSRCIISRRESSTATKRSISILIFFFVAAIFTISVFSRMNLMSNIHYIKVSRLYMKNKKT